MDVFAPAAALGRLAGNRNEENPELYAVFPFGWIGMDSAELARARRTYEARLFPCARPWSQCPLVASCPGLGEEAWTRLVIHAQQYQRYPFGGWTSSDSVYWPNGLSVAPFLDAAGLHALGLQECLLQSHDGVIRVAPALAAKVSGLFRVRAEGGFLVSAELAQGQPHYVVVESEQGGVCTVSRPFSEVYRVTCKGQEILVSAEDRMVFPTEPGQSYLLEPWSRRIRDLPVERVADGPSSWPGMWGRRAE
jgi:hypothetical protein